MRVKRLWRTGIFPVLFFFALMSRAVPAAAQGFVRSWLPWRTVETKHFVFHYPVELEAWTQFVASRADAIDSTVERIVGYAPERKTQVVVDDPYGIANGSAWPFLRGPVINLWATPPDPRNDIGEFRDWGPTLLSHEFTHIAHLARPSRNARLRALWSLAPADLGPITIDAPRWVIEGYATYAEGRATGSGRPHGTWRPAFLRRWALEGQLPRYEQLNGYGSYEGGEFAYLAGSAFLEWLAVQHGDSSLVDVWRRMTAKEPRGFDEAFVGVYGESARALYGRFTAELTGRALEIERAFRASAPGDTGQIVQRLTWSTGDPAISRDGRRVAIALASPTQPSRIVIWGTAPEPDTTRAHRDSALRANDPQDVPARPIYPPPKRVLAVLRASAGAPYESPRFFADGRVLVTRLMRVGDGSLRSDLFIWDPQRRSVRRVTRRAGITDGDPLPDGRSALATRCAHGWCDVAQVDLATGAVTTVLSGSPTRSFYRPRVSPDGARFAVSMNEAGRWRMLVVDRATGAQRELDFRGNAYDAAWAGADALVLTDDSDGTPEVKLHNLNTATTVRLTAVTGAAVAPEPSPRDSAIWFLSLHSRGYDLRRIPVRTIASIPDVAVDPLLVPAAERPPVDAPPFATSPVSPPRRYGLGNRLFRWAPLPHADADGYAGTLALWSTDVVGRSEIIAKGAAGDLSQWHGASLDASWRGMRPFIRLELFAAAQKLSESRADLALPVPLDVSMQGGIAGVDGSRAYESWSARYRLGVSASRISDSSTSRTFGVGDLGFGWLQRFGPASSLSETLAGNVTLGRSYGQGFSRGVASGGISASGFLPVPFSLAASYGRTSNDAPLFERMALGGSPSDLIDRLLLTQRIVMPVLPAGVGIGTSAFSYRVTLHTQPLNLYFWSGSASDSGRFAGWHRVYGAEGSLAVSAIPVAGVPNTRLVYGIGESIDEPFRKQVRGYVSVVINP